MKDFKAPPRNKVRTTGNQTRVTPRSNKTHPNFGNKKGSKEGRAYSQDMKVHI